MRRRRPTSPRQQAHGLSLSTLGRRTFFLGFVAVARLDEIMGGDDVSSIEKLKAIYKEAVATMTIHIIFYLAAPTTTVPLANKITR